MANYSYEQNKNYGKAGVGILKGLGSIGLLLGGKAILNARNNQKIAKQNKEIEQKQNAIRMKNEQLGARFGGLGSFIYSSTIKDGTNKIAALDKDKKAPKKGIW